MVQRTQIVLVDDIDGGTADESVSFALDGVAYEVDLSTDNAAQLRESLSRWVEHGRRQGGSRRAPGRRASAGSRSSTSSDANDVRQWAKDNGYTVSERGRISAEVREAYAAAH